MKIKDFTRDDVRNMYRFILGREPENEAAVENHFKGCSKLSDLLQTFYQSNEFQNKIKKPQTVGQRIRAQLSYLFRAIRQSIGSPNKIKIPQENSQKYITNNEEEVLMSVKIDDKTFEMAGDDYLTIYVKNDFEPHMVYLFKSLVNKTDNVLDIGANIGCTSILFGALANKVVSLEPNPSAFDFLKRNISNSRLKNVVIQNIGLGASAGEFEMAFDRGNRSGSFINNFQQASSEHEKVKVHIERLDDVEDRFKLFPIDLIKIDVEGFEQQVLQGAIKTIEKNKPIVVLEMNHWCLNAFQRICVPDFLDFLRSVFPVLLAVDGRSYANLHDKDESFSVMERHIIHAKYSNIVAAFDEARLSRFRQLFTK